MLFLLTGPEYFNIQSNATKVKVHLRNGIAEILDQHQDLMGRVDNNLVEVETNFENKVEKLLFIVQDAVFVVSNKGLESNKDLPFKEANVNFKGTSVYVYAKNVRQITSTTTVEEMSKQYDQKNIELEKEINKLNTSPATTSNARIRLITDEAEFLRRAVNILKELKS
jgi:hypothetical protein